MIALLSREECDDTQGLASRSHALRGRARVHESRAVAAWRDQIGSSFDRQVIEKSPVHAAARVRAPVLLLVSAQDTVIPPSQSEQMANALKEAGARVTLVKLEGEDHWLSRSSTRVQMLRELDTFLSANLH